MFKNEPEPSENWSMKKRVRNGFIGHKRTRKKEKTQNKDQRSGIETMAKVAGLCLK